jgi:hypothetical protein
VVVYTGVAYLRRLRDVMSQGPREVLRKPVSAAVVLTACGQGA